jgi:hypothetical protein
MPTVFHGANAADEISPSGSLEAARSSTRITPYRAQSALCTKTRDRTVSPIPTGQKLSEEPIHESVGVFPTANLFPVPP